MDVEQDDVTVHGPDHIDRLVHARRLAYHLNALPVDLGDDARADQGVIVDHDDFHCSSSTLMWTSVPPVGSGERMFARPPARSMRP